MHATRPGLIWGFEVGPDGTRATEDCDGVAAFRWLHFNLAHQGTVDWILHAEALTPAVREMLLSTDGHQRALIDGGIIGCVLHDFERDFDTVDNTRIGSVHFALTPTLMITARLHPVRSADVIRDKLERGVGIADQAAAFELLVNTITEIVVGTLRDLSATVQKAEDAFLDERDPPTARSLISIRRRLARIHRLLSDMRSVLQRLEADEDLPARLFPAVEKLSQRLRALDADTLGVQRQLRLLREEIDMQADQRTSQNLYILSILTALMLPATFVTGLFGMNTGGLPWASTSYGTLAATLAAFGAAAATYLLLRLLGFMRR